MLHQRLTQAAPAERTPSLVVDVLSSARPRQWIKNGFVFAALIFASKLGHPDLVARVVAAFVLFSILSSGVYLLNDTIDRDADRQHPLKANRPIAAGRVPVRLAVALASAALIGGLALSTLLDSQFGFVAALYAASSIAYSLYLKHLVLIDVLTIAGGFVLRAVGGAAVIHVHISPWLYLCTILLSLLLGFGKRRHELLLLEEDAPIHRRNLEEYTGALLDDLINIVAGAAIIAYSLYTFTPFESAAPQNHAMMVTIPFVLYGVFRYLLLVHRTDFAGAPEEAVWKDVPLLIDLLAWVAASAVILHLYK